MVPGISFPSSDKIGPGKEEILVIEDVASFDKYWQWRTIYITSTLHWVLMSTPDTLESLRYPSTMGSLNYTVDSFSLSTLTISSSSNNTQQKRDPFKGESGGQEKRETKASKWHAKRIRFDN